AIHRRAQAERLHDHELTWSIGQVIFATQDVRDAHARVVHGIREEERRRAVGAANDEIADVVAQVSLLAVHEIREFDALAERHAEARGRRDALRPLARL